MADMCAWLGYFIPESRTTQSILIGALVGLVIYFITKKRYRLPPGPRGWPFIGNLLDIGDTPMYLKLFDWEKKYGSVMTIGLGPTRCICLNRLDVIQEAFIKKSTDFAGRPYLWSLDEFTKGGKDIAFSTISPAWQLHRRLAIKALNFYMKGDRFEATIKDAMEPIVEDLKTKKDDFDITPHVKLIIFNILGIICFDERFGLDNDEFQTFSENLDTAADEFGNGFLEDVIPLLRYIQTPKYKKLKKAIEGTMQFIYTRVDKHRATFTLGHERDFTDAMLLAQKDVETEENPELLAQITDEHLAQTVSNIFQAGVDTSRHTIYWALLYMVAYPDIQARVQEEADMAMGDRSYPLMKDREKLPYTLAVLYETMRMAPIAPLSLPHATICDTTIGDYEIPSGTMILANIYSVHTDPALWDEPMKFKPERYLDSSGHIMPRKEQWMPFSIGKRACLAEALAKPELHLVLATLLKNLKFSLPEGVSADLEPLTRGVAVIAKPYKVMVTERT